MSAPAFPEAAKFLRETGPLSGDLLRDCAGLQAPPDGFERVWAAFEPMEKMQKRGQIVRPQTGEAWQLLCDEGAAMGATDWAPPPLAYFAAGLASSAVGAIAAALVRAGAPADGISLTLDNRYTLSGSILRGTMEGKGHDPDIAVEISGTALTAGDKSALALDAVSGSLAAYVLKNRFAGSFGLAVDGAPVSLDLPECALAVDASDLPAAALDPAGAGPAYVSKNYMRPDDPDFVASGGFGLDPVQNRTFKVSATATPAADGTIALESGIARPKMSVYGFRGSGDAGGPGAPSSACLIAAGIGFCYMTQLGRYAEAQKRHLAGYRMIQAIDIPRADGNLTPAIATKLFIEQDRPDEDFARAVAQSGKRTCFLHATLGDALRSRISVA